MKTKFILISLLLSTAFVSAQTSNTDFLNVAQLIDKGDSLSTINEHASALVVYDSARLLLLTDENWDDYFYVVENMIYQYSSSRNGMGYDFAKEQIELAEEKIPNEDEIIGLLYFRQGDIAQDNKDIENAIIAYNAAIKRYEEVLELDDSRMIQAYKKIGLAYSEHKEWDKAKHYLDLCLQTSIAKKDTTSLYRKDLAETYLGYAIMNKELALYKKSIEYYKEAMGLYKSIQDTFHMGVVHYNMGYAYQLDKQIDNSLVHLHRANEIFIESLGENHGIVLASYNLLSNSYSFIDKEEQIRYLKKSLKIVNQLYEGGHVRTGIIMENLYNALLETNKIEEAIIYGKDAHVIFEKFLPKYHSLKISSLYHLSQYYVDYTDYLSLETASQYLELLLDQVQNVYGENHYELNRYYIGKSKIAFIEKDFEQAIFYAEEVLRVNSWKTRNSTEKASIAIENRYIEPNISNDAYNFIANSQFQIWQKNPKSMHYIDSCLVNLESCHTLYKQMSQIERNKKNLQGHILDAMNYTSELYTFDSDNTAYFDMFFNWSERLKGQKIVQSITEADAKAVSNISEEYLTQESDLSQQIFIKEQEVFTAIENKDSLISDIRTEMFELRVQKNNLVEQIENEYPEYYNIKTGIKPYSVGKVQSLLSDKELLVNLTFDKKEGFSYFSGMDKEERFLKKVSLDIEVFDKIKAFNKLLRSPTLFRKNKREKFINLSNELYQNFVRPIEPYLAGKEKLILIGDDMTHYLPFEVLLKAKDNKPFHELDYLVNKYQISYHYSSTLFAQAREKEISEAQGILAFAPVFSDELSATHSLASTRYLESDSLANTYRAVDKEGNFLPLAYSLKEVKQISKLVNKSANQKADLLLFDDANEQNLKVMLEKPHRFVHIASHSFANLSKSKFSGVACAPPSVNPATKEDGVLYVGEVYNLDIDADLAVLSSCESGLGELQDGEGLIGLNRSFIYSGVPNVVFSLWKVNDKVSSELMIEFYQEVLNGEDYASALRQAKLKLLKNENTASPNLWSSFLLIGR